MICITVTSMSCGYIMVIVKIVSDVVTECFLFVGTSCFQIPTYFCRGGIFRIRRRSMRGVFPAVMLINAVIFLLFMTNQGKEECKVQGEGEGAKRNEGE